MSYLLSYSQADHTIISQSGPRNPFQALENLPSQNAPIPPLTPPSSFSANVDIPGQPSSSPVDRPYSLPLTPMSIPPFQPMNQSLPAGSPQKPAPLQNSSSRPPILLLDALFTSQQSITSLSAHALEIVTPPDNILQGFIVDQPIHGRAVYIHLQTPRSARDQNRDLPANFSEVLRPHDPSRLSAIEQSTSEAAHLDVRESLTALLDLASDPLDANQLILVLSRDERGNEALDEMLHSLMYVGGQMIRQGLLEGGWEWDPSKWILVGMEL